MDATLKTKASRGESGGDRLVVLGDIHVGTLERSLKQGRDWKADETLQLYLAGASTVVANLEGVICVGGTPTRKSGGHSRGGPTVVEALRRIGVSHLALANNHSFDYGAEGLRSTIEVLGRIGIKYAGAGECEDEAWKPMVATIGVSTVGILSMCQNEFGVARDEAPGVAGFDEWRAMSALRQAREKCDSVVVLYHGGLEYERLPSPGLRRRCRFLVEAGASVVICQHQHVTGASERWEDATIVYGQGNFIAETSHAVLREAQASACLIEISGFGGRRDLAVTHRPIGRQRQPGEVCLRLLKDLPKARAVEELDGLNRLLTDKAEWRSWWRRTTQRLGPDLEAAIAQEGRVRRYLARRMAWMGKRLRGKNEPLITNIVRCECHREVLTTWLEGRAASGGTR